MNSLEESIASRSRDNLKQDVIQRLSTWLHENNQLVNRIKIAWEGLSDAEKNDNRCIRIREDKRPQGEHARRYNAATAPEVAILMDN